MAVPTAVRVLEGKARVYRYTWRGSVISTFLNPVLFLAAMGLGLGSLVDEGTGSTGLGGLSYVTYLAPGLLVAAAMQTAAGDASFPVMAGMKWTKIFHAAVATPVGSRDLVLGHLAWIAIRLTFSATVFVAVMALFEAVPLGRGLAAVPAAVLTGLAFAAPITGLAAWLEQATGLSTLFRFGIVPMFLFSGTFFPISQLPGWLQPVAGLVPLWHGVELARTAALETTPSLPIPAHVAYLLVWAAVGSVIAVGVFRGRLET